VLDAGESLAAPSEEASGHHGMSSECLSQSPHLLVSGHSPTETANSCPESSSSLSTFATISLTFGEQMNAQAVEKSVTGKPLNSREKQHS
jgi:hypothetical protein